MSDSSSSEGRGGGDSSEKPWVDTVEKGCWNSVNRLAGEAEDSDFDAVRLSDEATYQYCVDQLELVEAMAVDLGVPTEVAMAKTEFLTRFIDVVYPGRVNPRDDTWWRDICSRYTYILQELQRLKTVIGMRQIEGTEEGGVDVLPDAPPVRYRAFFDSGFSAENRGGRGRKKGGGGEGECGDGGEEKA